MLKWLLRYLKKRRKQRAIETRIRQRLVENNRFTEKEIATIFSILRKNVRRRSEANKQIKKRLTNTSRADLKYIEKAISLEFSRESLLDDLRRSSEIGVTHVRLSSCHDERDTEMEKRLDGKRMTIQEARKLAEEHIDDIPRSIFQPEIKF